MTAPEFSGLVKLAKEGWDGIPDGPNPFYFGANDGLFLTKKMLIGRGVVRVERWPATFPKFGDSVGGFDFTANPIPAKLMGQIVNFFERIYDKQHTEAAVLLIMHAETKEWRVFIPTQLVSHGGVNYVFNPAHIQWPWSIVGSIHSHCDFGAGHSGVDTGDADGFDGLHCTIGMIKRDVPQIVAMVAMNHKLFHYKPEQFPDLFDFSEPKAHEAPAWWDRYVEDTKNKVKPIGFELYAKFQKSTLIKQEQGHGSTIKRLPAQGYQSPPSSIYQSYNPDDWSWNEKVRRMVHKDWTVDDDGTIYFTEHAAKAAKERKAQAIKNVTPTIIKPLGENDDDWDDFYRLQGMDGPPDGYEGYHPRQLMEAGFAWLASEKRWEWVGQTAEDRFIEMMESRATNESKEFNARKAAERGVKWLDGKLDDDEFWRKAEEDHWEDILDRQTLEILYDSELLNEEDVDFAIRNPRIAGDPEFWKENLLRKALSAANALREMGLDVGIRVGESHDTLTIDNPIALLPETATPPQNMKGAI